MISGFANFDEPFMLLYITTEEIHPYIKEVYVYQNYITVKLRTNDCIYFSYFFCKVDIIKLTPVAAMVLGVEEHIK